MEEVSLDDIEYVTLDELSQDRLDTLLNGFSSFEDVLYSSSTPIVLDAGSEIPYSITDRRHRVYLAREQGYTSVPAVFE